MDVKKILICLLALTTTVSTIPNGAISHSTDYVYAETSTDGSFEYSIYDLAKKTVTIKKYTGTDTEVTIPETIDGYTVVAIGFSAFEDCTSLTSVVIPDTVTSISDGVLTVVRH